LLIGLAAGILAFQMDKGLSFNPQDKAIVVVSVLFIVLSIGIGCWLAWNRLISFRLTAQIARRRETAREEGIEDLRGRTGVLSKRTWRLISCQIIFFGLGVLLIGIVIIKAVMKGMGT
jgi:hypothetical protein